MTENQPAALGGSNSSPNPADWPPAEAEAPRPLRDVAAEQTAAVAETSGRSLARGVIDVELEDGTGFVVTIDNRDYVRWDLRRQQEKWPGGEEVPFLFQTFLAWSAAVRRELTDLRFEKFRDVCVLAAMRRPDSPDEDDAARPTR